MRGCSSDQAAIVAAIEGDKGRTDRASTRW
jgi:hypothetical protein